ncbi:MAG: carboxymuconolactone decarboxylase family protein [Candidatus Eisenbacteria bacterium]|nr:carboxymuconolactone decarboxylase family protein [Candidatus Eisenbacteria bacterium]
MSGATDPKGRLPEAPKAFRKFQDAHPEVSAAYEALGEAVRRAGPLTGREVALVKLAISIGARLEGAAHAHSRKALAAGIEPEALRQVAILAAPTIGFPPMMAGLGWVEETIEKRAT